MNIYSYPDDETLIELRDWMKNNPPEIPKNSIFSYGAIKGEKHHESTKQLLREINLGKKLSEETKRKISNSLKGVVPWNVGIPNNPKQKEKISNSLAKTWLITYPDGTKETIKNLKKFCNEKGLFQSCMILVSQGKQKNHKGFICRPG